MAAVVEIAEQTIPLHSRKEDIRNHEVESRRVHGFTGLLVVGDDAGDEPSKGQGGRVMGAALQIFVHVEDAPANTVVGRRGRDVGAFSHGLISRQVVHGVLSVVGMKMNNVPWILIRGMLHNTEPE